MCLPERCPNAGNDLSRASAAPAAEVVEPGPEDSIEAAVRAFVAQLPRYGPADPRGLMATIVVRTAAQLDQAGPNMPAALLRELRTWLMQLAEVPNGPSGVVDEIRVRRAQSTLDRFLGGLGVPRS